MSPFQPSLKSAFVPEPLLSIVLGNFNSISVCYPRPFLSFFSVLKQNWPKSFKYMAKQWRRREQQSHTISLLANLYTFYHLLSASSPAPYFREKNRSTEAFSIRPPRPRLPPASVHIYLPTFLLVSKVSLFTQHQIPPHKKIFLLALFVHSFSYAHHFFLLYWISSTTVQTVKYL